jgi:hypothetical protein
MNDEVAGKKTRNTQSQGVEELFCVSVLPGSTLWYEVFITTGANIPGVLLGSGVTPVRYGSCTTNRDITLLFLTRNVVITIFYLTRIRPTYCTVTDIFLQKIQVHHGKSISTGSIVTNQSVLLFWNSSFPHFKYDRCVL